MLTHRIVFDDNALLYDVSLDAKSTGFTKTFIASEDYLYIGQQFPFNSFFVEITTANINTSSLSIEYWDDSNWTSAVDILDGTSANGITFAQTGIIRFTTDENNRWSFVDNTADEANFGNLANVNIYDMYWLRLKVSADTSAIGFGEISYMFGSNTTLPMLDPDINEYLTNWESGKTDWIDQLKIASQRVVIDLKKKNLIRDQAQILLIDRELELLTCYKALEVIYSGLGGDKFTQKKEDTEKTYSDILSGLNVVVDANNDGLLRKSEVRIMQGRVLR